MPRRVILSKAIQATALLLSLAFLFCYVNDNLVISNSTVVHGRSVAIVAKSKAARNHTHADGGHNFTNPQDNSVQIQLLTLVNRKLPSFANGGVIVFLHIPKTGGTSFRKGFQKRRDVIYLFSNRRARYETVVETVQDWVTNGPQDNRTGILEVHARNNPTLLELCEQLQEWRETALQNQIPFWAFTILREPLSFQISYFNYYHGIQWEKRRFEYLPREQMTEANFLRTMHFNPQCLFLARSEQAFQRNHPEMRQNLTQSECKQAYKCLKTNMDWIGSTERLQNETIPLLNYIINSSHRKGNESTVLGANDSNQDVKLQNAGPKIFGLQNLSRASLEQIHRMTQWDQEMYQKMFQEFQFQSYGLD